jgi:hypothetical protein
MHSILVHGEHRRRKIGISEGANRNSDGFFAAFPTARTERERCPSAFVSYSYELRSLTRDHNRLRRKPSLRPKDTSSPALASEAVTDRDAHWISGDFGFELAATARGDSCAHGSYWQMRGVAAPNDN